MNLCKNCVHWKVDKDYSAFGGQCNSGKFVYTVEFQGDNYHKKPDSDMVEYGDYEGYSAYLLTGPEFGCIHGKGKKGE